MKNIAVLIQLLGLVACFTIFPLGLLAGLALILVGGSIYRSSGAAKSS